MNTSTMAAAPKRPQFLTILCILSFIGVGFSVIGGLIGYAALKFIGSGKLDDLLSQSADPSAMLKFDDAKAQMMATGLSLDQLGHLALIGSALALVSLLGVIMMWKLKRSGFYLYTLVQLVGLTAPLIMGGHLDMEWKAMIGMVITAAFIIMYALNLKAMR